MCFCGIAFRKPETNLSVALLCLEPEIKLKHSELDDENSPLISNIIRSVIEMQARTVIGEEEEAQEMNQCGFASRPIIKQTSLERTEKGEKCAHKEAAWSPRTPMT